MTRRTDEAGVQCGEDFRIELELLDRFQNVCCRPLPPAPLPLDAATQACITAAGAPPAWTNQTHEARVCSHDGPIRRGKHGYVPMIPTALRKA